MNPETCAEILMLVAVVLETLERLVIDERANGTMDSQGSTRGWWAVLGLGLPQTLCMLEFVLEDCLQGQ